MNSSKIGKLLLQRKPNESISIGDDIVVTITEISGSRVQVQITAPKETKVFRSETQKKKEVASS